MLMSVIVANDSSGSVDEATAAAAAAAASSQTSPSLNGEAAGPQPRPPLASPAPRKVNGAASAVESSKAAGRSDIRSSSSSSATGNSGRRRRRRRAKDLAQSKKDEEEEELGQQQQQEEEEEGGTNMNSLSSASELEQQQRQRMRRLGKQGMWRQVLEMLASIPAPSQRQYVAAIAACDFAGEPRQALRVHTLMVEQGLKPCPVRALSPVLTHEQRRGSSRALVDAASLHCCCHPYGIRHRAWQPLRLPPGTAAQCAVRYS